MKHILCSENKNNEYRIAVLIKEAAFNSNSLEEHYFNPLHNLGIPRDDIIGLSLKYSDINTSPMKLIKPHIDIILQSCDKLHIHTLLVADSAYFKKLAGQPKAEPHHGYVMPCKIKGYEHINIVLSINYQQLFYNPAIQDRLSKSIETISAHLQNKYVEIGRDIIHSAAYPNTLTSIRDWLIRLHQYPELTCDIEAFSLLFNEAGIGTISFAWDKHNGIAFPVDYCDKMVQNTITTFYGTYLNNQPVKALLKEFFLTYKGKLTYHNATYDIKVLIYELFMDNLLDNKGLIDGLDCMYKNMADTKVITYLATNTTAKNHLSLKHNSYEFAGNYAQDDDDIKDIRKIPLNKLLKYNLTDCLATWFVKEKNYPTMAKDGQVEIYNNIMIPSMKVITHMELTGMPMDLVDINILYKDLSRVIQTQKMVISQSKIITDFEWGTQRERCVMANLLLKKKVRPIHEFQEPFNPSSDTQVRNLLYDILRLPVIDKTKGKQPATGAKTIKKLLNHLTNKYNITEEDLK